MKQTEQHDIIFLHNTNKIKTIIWEKKEASTLQSIYKCSSALFFLQHNEREIETFTTCVHKWVWGISGRND